MTRRSAPTQPINGKLQSNRKSTQRERLVAGMIAAATSGGYARVSVSMVIGEAGVSRPTFYEYFADKDDCFLATIADSQQRLLAGIREAVEGQAPEHATQSAIGALLGFARAEPEVTRFLLNEPMAGGPRALDARDAGIAEIAQIIEQAHEQAPPNTATPDLSSRMLIGGIHRLLASRLRRGALALAGLEEELLDWIKSYEQPARKHRWHTLEPAPAGAPSPFLPDAPLRAPQALGPGRPRTSEEARKNHRMRILFAAAQIAREKGYTAATIAEITGIAEVDDRAFYRLFADKQDVFMALHEFVLQQIVAVTAAAFFAGATWPERMWEGVSAPIQFLASNPTIAHVGFVEAYAVGPAAVQRVEDSHIGFTIFLQEGYQYRPRSDPPSRLALEAIAVTQYELGYHQTRKNPAEIAAFIPHLVHLALTPFLGPAETNEFIDGKMGVSR
jgi:AcrR family transcriptional regulator